MNLHRNAWSTLQAWRSDDARQEALRQQMVQHLLEQPDGVWRRCFPDHITAGTVVFSADGTAVLLNLHRKAQRWFAFGGHCEADDHTLAAVALREAREESGLLDLDFDDLPVHLDVHEVGFCDPRGTVRHLDVRFVARAKPGAEHTASEESLDVRWWPLEALPEDLGEEMHELIGFARRRLARHAR